MRGIIVTGHGNFASGVGSTVKLVMGEQEKTAFIDFTENMSSSELSSLLEKTVVEMGAEDGIVILADIMGGTPFNESAMLSSKYENITVFGGMNMAMLFEIIDSRDEELDTESVLEESRNGMGTFRIIENDLEESDCDGI